jgi:hypothetical protein
MGDLNRNGHPVTLQASHPNNTNPAKHGIYSARLREPRAQEIAAQIMAAPWAAEHLDEHGAVEIARVEALVEVLDEQIRQTGGKVRRDFVALRLRASRELREWLNVYGLVPHAQATWAAALGGSNLAAEITRRRAQSVP